MSALDAIQARQMEATRTLMLDAAVESMIKARGSDGKIKDKKFVGNLVKTLQGSAAFAGTVVSRHTLNNWERKRRSNFSEVQAAVEASASLIGAKTLEIAVAVLPS